jgi:hypothetical protein
MFMPRKIRGFSRRNRVDAKERPPAATDGPNKGETTLSESMVPILTESLEHRVRSNDPDTSWAAAEITPDANRDVKQTIYGILAGSIDPLTDDSIFFLYKESGGSRTAQRIRTARVELEREGLVVDARIPSITTNGGTARTWRIS